MDKSRSSARGVVGHVSKTDPRFFLVVDLEATTSDDGSLPPDEMECIEIGAVIVDAATLEPVDEYQSFVRPVRHPKLLPFCTQLTTIEQAMVDGAPLFPEAFAALQRKLAGRHPVVFASWGRYDRLQLQRDCLYHRVPFHLAPHWNVKVGFSEAQQLSKKLGLGQAVKHCGLTFAGTVHRGIDDARNIARLLPWVVGPKARHLVRPGAEAER
jgi:inhibitor of KinA sporulation pathway (predicted exonuclease)